jgi:hypothetical protein
MLADHEICRFLSATKLDDSLWMYTFNSNCCSRNLIQDLLTYIPCTNASPLCGDSSPGVLSIRIQRCNTSGRKNLQLRSPSLVIRSHLGCLSPYNNQAHYPLCGSHWSFVFTHKWSATRRPPRLASTIAHHVDHTCERMPCLCNISPLFLSAPRVVNWSNWGRDRRTVLHLIGGVWSDVYPLSECTSMICNFCCYKWWDMYWCLMSCAILEKNKYRHSLLS